MLEGGARSMGWSASKQISFCLRWRGGGGGVLNRSTPTGSEDSFYSHLGGALHDSQLKTILIYLILGLCV